MHIRDSCRRITEYAAAGRPEWTSQPFQLDESFRQKHAEIPWSGIIGARNIVMHAYEYLKPELIREMAEEEVPELLKHCLRLLGEA
jgi:uncharacterized protein with HEPN domain